MSQQKSEYAADADIDASLDDLPTDEAIRILSDHIEQTCLDVTDDYGRRPAVR